MRPKPWFPVLLLVIAVLLTGSMRAWVQDHREILQPHPKVSSRMSGVDTFTLGLVLGGLRGPLTMMLWTSTENQKIDKNLEDIDTKLELIRMLQPEFDSVLIFQTWNKAYNLSVQMASPANKYATILDAIDYGRRTDQERPDNVNVLWAIADLYGTKLGNSAEKRYYTARVRQQTLARSASSQKRPGQGDSRMEQQPLLDENGFILPRFFQPRVMLGNAAAGVEKYDGSELQYLKPYNTPEAGGFPHGIPPQAIGYSYFMRVSILARTTSQRHLQNSDSVIDSHPALGLKAWADEEWERARRQEILSLGKQVPEERLAMENVAAAAPLKGKFVDNSEKTKKAVEDALFSYRRAARLAREAIVEYHRHMDNVNFAATSDTYRSHIDTMTMTDAICSADHDYLELLAASAGFETLTPQRRKELAESARKQYQLAIDQNYILILKYYVDDEVAAVVYPEMTQKRLGKKIDRPRIDKADPKIYPDLLQAVREYLKKNKKSESNADDISEYETYIKRARQRLIELGQNG
jgi:hypothetical protein